MTGRERLKREIKLLAQTIEVNAVTLASKTMTLDGREEALIQSQSCSNEAGFLPSHTISTPYRRLSKTFNLFASTPKGKAARTLDALDVAAKYFIYKLYDATRRDWTQPIPMRLPMGGCGITI